jgi:hypothetical protein
MHMTIDELVQKLLSRTDRWHPGKGLSAYTVLEWANVAGEAGECCNAAAKLRRMELGIRTLNLEPGRQYPDMDAARLKVAKEAVDAIFYALQTIVAVGHIPEETIIKVFNQKSIEYGFPERL